MTVFQSTYLFALLGLLVPVIVHLWSKKNRTPIPFGSIRFVTPSTQRALKKIAPSDLWLFLLRCLIICFLIALLTDVRFNSWSEQKKRTYYVDSAYTDDPAAVEILLKISDTTTVNWLPEVLPDERLALWNQVVSSSDVIVTPWSPAQNSSSTEAFKNLNFLSLPNNLQNIELGIGKVDAQSVQVLATFDMSAINIERQPVETAPTTIRFYLNIEKDYQPQANILLAALKTLHEKGFYDLEEVTDVSSADLLIWMTRDQPPKSSEQLITLSEAVSAWTEYSKDIAELPASMTSKQAIQSDLIHQLYQWLDPFREQIQAYDVRSTFALTESSIALSETNQQILRDLRWLWLTLLVLCIGIERWIALK